MKSLKSLLLAGSALAVLVAPAAVAAPRSAAHPIVLAQAGDPAVAAAEAKVEAARAALKKAQDDGKDVEAAQAALDAALAELESVKAAAAQPPAGNPPPPPAAENPAPADQPPAAAAENPPPAEKAAPPANAETQPPADKPPAQDAQGKPQFKKKPPQNAEGQPPAPPAGQQPPANAQAQPPANQPPPPAAAAGNPPPPPAAGNPPPAAAQGNPPPPAGGNPPPQQAEGQPGPGPGKFDPSVLKRQHPRFGDAPQAEPAKPPAALPTNEAAIPKGGEIQAGAGRVIVKEDNGQVTVKHDDAERFRRLGGQVNSQRGPGGTTTTTVERPGGIQIVTVTDDDGNIVQRYRKNRDGSIQVLIGAGQAGMPQPPRGNNRPPPPPRPPQGPSVTFDFHNKLPPIRLNIPRDRYIVESSRATPQQLEQTFEAPPVEQVERPYTLEEIRRSDRIRDKVRRVDFDTVTFETGSAVLPDDQIAKVQAIGEAISAVIAQDPTQVFLIEGHTDAVGSDLANLALSDRRAETVAEILTYYFSVPPENLVTQGYGEQFLKVPTTGAERQNRRVAFRNITPLMVGQNQ